MAYLYVLDINHNDELLTVIKKCNENFRSIVANNLKQRQIDAGNISEQVSQLIGEAVDELVILIGDEAGDRRDADDDLEDSIETLAQSLAAVATSGDYNDLINTPTMGTIGVDHGGTGVNTLGAGLLYHSPSGTGPISVATGQNIVSEIGNNAVNRATADANGNAIVTTYATKSELVGMYKYKGSVATEANLPVSGQEVGDVYNIEAASSYGGAGANVAWNGTSWDGLGEIFAISSITNSEIDNIIAS